MTILFPDIDVQNPDSGTFLGTVAEKGEVQDTLKGEMSSMEWKFDSKRPIYIQLVEKIELLIVTGVYEPGSKLSPVRELAAEAGVNPNTMQRALSALEDAGLMYSRRTAGRFITEDEEMIRMVRKSLAKEKVEAFIEEMKKLGFTPEEIMKIVEEKSNA